MTAVDFFNTESRHLRRHLRRVDSIFFAIAAIVSLDTIGQIAAQGAEVIFWTLVLACAFLFPYGLLIAELGSSFTQEGGPYVWMRLAFGRFAAGVGTVFYWVTNPVWLGGSLRVQAGLHLDRDSRSGREPPLRQVAQHRGCHRELFARAKDRTRGG